jgi:hypothetical protein
MPKLTSITPGESWLDTDGNRVQAHGGSIITVDGVFYWYGENSGSWREGIDSMSRLDV